MKTIILLTLLVSGVVVNSSFAGPDPKSVKAEEGSGAQCIEVDFSEMRPSAHSSFDSNGKATEVGQKRICESEGGSERLPAAVKTNGK